MRRLRLYLDPFTDFKSIASDAGALDYNRRHRGQLLRYLKRWAIITLLCALALEPLAPLARTEPLLWVPIAGLTLGFCAGVCLLLLAAAVYVVLGLEP
jgi:hypothetical protein